MLLASRLSALGVVGGSNVTLRSLRQCGNGFCLGCSERGPFWGVLRRHSSPTLNT